MKKKIVLVALWAISFLWVGLLITSNQKSKTEYEPLLQNQEFLAYVQKMDSNRNQEDALEYISVEDLFSAFVHDRKG